MAKSYSESIGSSETLFGLPAASPAALANSSTSNLRVAYQPSVRSKGAHYVSAESCYMPNSRIKSTVTRWLVYGGGGYRVSYFNYLRSRKQTRSRAGVNVKLISWPMVPSPGSHEPCNHTDAF